METCTAHALLSCRVVTQESAYWRLDRPAKILASSAVREFWAKLSVLPPENVS